MSKRPELMVCTNRRFGGTKPSCAARGSVAIADAVEQAFAERDLDILVTRSVCQNACERGPSLRLLPGPKLFLGLELKDVPNLVATIESHLRAQAGEPPATD